MTALIAVLLVIELIFLKRLNIFDELLFFSFIAYFGISLFRSVYFIEPGEGGGSSKWLLKGWRAVFVNIGMMIVLFIAFALNKGTIEVKPLLYSLFPAILNGYVLFKVTKFIYPKK